MSFIGPKDVRLEIAKGNVAGSSTVLKFGRNQVVGTSEEDVWDGGGSYAFYPTTGKALQIRSTAAGDTQTVEIQGLSSAYAPQTESVTLSGTGFVALSNKYNRVFRMKNTGAANNAGSIICSASGSSEVAAQISVGQNQTLMALYTIPAGVTGYMTNFFASVDKNAGGAASVDINLRVRPAPSSAKVFQSKHRTGLNVAGDSHVNHIFGTPLKVLEKEDITLRAEANSGTIDCQAGFDIILVDNT